MEILLLMAPNDNAAGSTAVILWPNILQKLKIISVAFCLCYLGAEEKGLLGSKHLAKVLKEKNLNLYTMVNLK